ncbi:MAG: SRPBCC family protein [Thermoproteota archaeon]|nr:SRPBCC family protein [Thermoproteota archaeon]
MTIISTVRNVNASTDKVWNIVSDVDRDPEFWHGTKSINNIKKEGNTIERETTIAFKKSKCREIIRLEDKKRVEIQIIDGPIVGKKTIDLQSIEKDKTKLTVKWDIHMKGLMSPFTFFIKNHILKGTEEAISRIEEKTKVFDHL